MLWKPSEFHKHPNSCRADTVWGLWLDLGSLSSPEKVAEEVVCRVSPFTGQPRSYLSEPYWSLWSETGPAVCFTASDNGATELCLTVLIALGSYRFLENKTCPLCHAQIDQSQQDRQNKAAGRLRWALHCVETLPQPGLEPWVGREPFRSQWTAPVWYHSALQSNCCSQQEPTRRMKTKQKRRDIWCRKQWCFPARYLLTLPDSNLLPAAQKAHHST